MQTIEPIDHTKYLKILADQGPRAALVQFQADTGSKAEIAFYKIPQENGTTVWRAGIQDMKALHGSSHCCPLSRGANEDEAMTDLLFMLIEPGKALSTKQEFKDAVLIVGQRRGPQRRVFANHIVRPSVRSGTAPQAQWLIYD